MLVLHSHYNVLCEKVCIQLLKDKLVKTYTVMLKDHGEDRSLFHKKYIFSMGVLRLLSFVLDCKQKIVIFNSQY